MAGLVERRAEERPAYRSQSGGSKLVEVAAEPPRRAATLRGQQRRRPEPPAQEQPARSIVAGPDLRRRTPCCRPAARPACRSCRSVPPPGAGLLAPRDRLRPPAPPEEDRRAASCAPWRVASNAISPRRPDVGTGERVERLGEEVDQPPAADLLPSSPRDRDARRAAAGDDQPRLAILLPADLAPKATHARGVGGGRIEAGERAAERRADRRRTPPSRAAVPRRRDEDAVAAAGEDGALRRVAHARQAEPEALVARVDVGRLADLGQRSRSPAAR